MEARNRLNTTLESLQDSAGDAQQGAQQRIEAARDAVADARSGLNEAAANAGEGAQEALRDARAKVSALRDNLNDYASQFRVQSETGAEGEAALGVTLQAGDNSLSVGTVTEGSIGANAGLQSGDQILAVEREWVNSPEQFRTQLQAAAEQDGKAWIYVERDGSRQWVQADFAGEQTASLTGSN